MIFLTIEQERAQHALKQIRSLQRTQPESWQERYKSYVKGLPATIVSNGLGQALATLLAAAKGESTDPHHVLYQHLELWLCRPHPLAPYRDEKHVIDAIIAHDAWVYRIAQMEAMAYLVWLKKFAAAYLKGKERD